MDRQEINNHFASVVDIIKSHLESWQIERGWAFIGNREPLPTDITDRIWDIVVEYTDDNDLPDTWHEDYDAEDFFMEIDNN